jgi:hypothetical protein
MEIVTQWLDDLDDFFGAIGLIRERLRNLLIGLSSLAIALLVPAAGIGLALRHPPLALASAIILFVILLYRSVTEPHSLFGENA